MAGIPIGPGVDQKIKDIQATPLDAAGEVYQPSSFSRSITQVMVGASDGTDQSLRLVVYDKARNVTFVMAPVDGPDGGDFFVGKNPIPEPVGGIVLKGIDIGFPPSESALAKVVRDLGCTFIACYIGGADYIGNWTANLARSLQPVLDEVAQSKGLDPQKYAGFCPIFVPHQATIAAGDQDMGVGDGSAALQNAKIWGFTKGGNIFIDVERGTWDASNSGCISYLHGTEIALSDDPDWGPGLYGPRPALDALKDDPSLATWLAAWDGDPNVENFDMHQYLGSTTIDGVGVDLNVAVLRTPAFELARF